MGMLEAKGEKASPEKLKAKMGVVKDLRDMMAKLMHDKMGQDSEDMKKVTVAAPDQESLSHGLDKAKELVGHMPEMDDHNEMDEDPQEESLESPEMEASEPEEDHSDMESKIAHMEQMLQEMKDQLKMKA